MIIMKLRLWLVVLSQGWSWRPEAVTAVAVMVVVKVEVVVTDDDEEEVKKGGGGDAVDVVNGEDGGG